MWSFISVEVNETRAIIDYVIQGGKPILDSKQSVRVAGQLWKFRDLGVEIFAGQGSNVLVETIPSDLPLNT